MPPFIHPGRLGNVPPEDRRRSTSGSNTQTPGTGSNGTSVRGTRPPSTRVNATSTYHAAGGGIGPSTTGRTRSWSLSEQNDSRPPPVRRGGPASGNPLPTSRSAGNLTAEEAHLEVLFAQRSARNRGGGTMKRSSSSASISHSSSNGARRFSSATSNQHQGSAPVSGANSTPLRPRSFSSAAAPAASFPSLSGHSQAHSLASQQQPMSRDGRSLLERIGPAAVSAAWPPQQRQQRQQQQQGPSNSSMYTQAHNQQLQQPPQTHRQTQIPQHMAPSSNPNETLHINRFSFSVLHSYSVDWENDRALGYDPLTIVVDYMNGDDGGVSLSQNEACERCFRVFSVCGKITAIQVARRVFITFKSHAAALSALHLPAESRQYDIGDLTFGFVARAKWCTVENEWRTISRQQYDFAIPRLRSGDAAVITAGNLYAQYPYLANPANPPPPLPLPSDLELRTFDTLPAVIQLLPMDLSAPGLAGGGGGDGPGAGGGGGGYGSGGGMHASTSLPVGLSGYASGPVPAPAPSYPYMTQ